MTLCGLSAARAYDAFLLLQGIPGESVDSRHSDWIDITSFQQGVAKSAGAPPRFPEMTFGKNLDKSSPLLSLRTANGQPIPRATLELTQAGDSRTRFYQVILSNCVVRATATGGSTQGQDRPAEQVALAYDWISWTYTEFDSSGNRRGDIQTFWDVLRNSGQGSFRLNGVKQGTNIVVSWEGVLGTTYRLSGSPLITGPYTLVQSVTPTSNGTVRLTFPLRTGNLFYRADATP